MMENHYLPDKYSTMNRNSARRILGLYLHYLYSMKRNPARIIEILIWPVFEIILFGLLAASNTTSSTDTAHLTLILLTGVIYWNFTARIIQESVAQFIDDFLSKNIQNILIAPIAFPELLWGIILASMTKLVLSTLSLAAILLIVFPAFFATVGIASLVWVFLLGFFGVSLSLVAIALIFMFGERVSFAGWMISTIVQVFSLVFYKREALPGLLYVLSYAVPSSYVFESIREYRPGYFAMTGGLLIPFALSIGYFGIGFVLSRASYVWAQKTGALAKL